MVRKAVEAHATKAVRKPSLTPTFATECTKELMTPGSTLSDADSTIRLRQSAMRNTPPSRMPSVRSTRWRSVKVIKRIAKMKSPKMTKARRQTA